jgi:endoglucanase
MACCAALLCVGVVQARCLGTEPLRGVNLSGAEFGEGRLPGVLNKDYVYPGIDDLRFFQKIGVSVVRIPFRWERIQRQPFGPLDPQELAQLQRVVAWGRDMNVCVLLDLHNFGTYQGHVLGSTALPVAAFIDVWLRLQREFADKNSSAFGLMNEPAALPVGQWMAIAQETVLALRKSGTENLLVVGSGRWSGAHEWEKPFDGASSSDLFRGFQDPLNRFAIELHQYADSSFAGTAGACVSAPRLRSLLSRVSDWARREKKQLFLGEFGVPASPDCLEALVAILDSVQDPQVWIGWTYWSAGRWWGKYPLSIQPTAGLPAPQLTVLRQYLP